MKDVSFPSFRIVAETEASSKTEAAGNGLHAIPCCFQASHTQSKPYQSFDTKLTPMDSHEILEINRRRGHSPNRLISDTLR
jgi:hypothetical protein